VRGYNTHLIRSNATRNTEAILAQAAENGPMSVSQFKKLLKKYFGNIYQVKGTSLDSVSKRVCIIDVILNTNNNNYREK
jgi:hypothetical protein